MSFNEELLEISGSLNEELLLEMSKLLDEELILVLLDDELLLVAELLELIFLAFFFIQKFGCQSSSPSIISVIELSMGLIRAILVWAPFKLVSVATIMDLSPLVAHSVWSKV